MPEIICNGPLRMGSTDCGLHLLLQRDVGLLDDAGPFRLLFLKKFSKLSRAQIVHLHPILQEPLPDVIRGQNGLDLIAQPRDDRRRRACRRRSSRG